MSVNWKAVGKLGLAAAKQIYPAIGAVESGVAALRAAKGAEKLDAAEALALNAIDLIEDVSDRDLLREQKVSEAYRALLSSHVHFMNALAAAKAARVSPVPPG